MNDQVPLRSISQKEFERLRDSLYRSLIRLEHQKTGAQEELLTSLRAAWDALDTTQSKEIQRWLLAVAPASVSLLVASQSCEVALKTTWVM